MKISQLGVLVMGSAWRNLTFLKLTTDEGLTGDQRGPAVQPHQRPARLPGGVQARYILGSDPFRIEHTRPAHVPRRLRPGRRNLRSAISLVEIACWDIVGKAANLPVYVLLGGAVRDKIKAYANAWYQVPRTPDEFAQAAKAAVAKGYRALKFDPFGAGCYEMERKDRLHCVSLVEAVPAAVGPDVELLIEMHGRFSPATAIRIAHDLEPFEPSWVEEPVPPDNLTVHEKLLPAFVEVVRHLPERAGTGTVRET